MLQLTPSTSAGFLDGVARSIQSALDDLYRHEEATANLWHASAAHDAWAGATSRLENNLSAWQTILTRMAEQVSTAQAELDVLDTDLKQAANSFVTARKHLQPV